MKKSVCFILCVLMCFGVLTGCSSKKNSSNNGIVKIVIWHDADEQITKTMEDKLNELLKDDKIEVSFEKKTGLTDQLKLYGNDEANGPDMYFYAHDSLGMLVEMGILAPISDVTSEDVTVDCLPMTVDACTYKGEQYLVPIYFETLLFLYNKDLWKGEVPNTTEELYNYMVDNTDVDAGTYAVVNQHSTAYNVAPIINGFGGYIIDNDGNPGLDDKFTKEAVEYNKKFAALQADGDYNTVTTLFNEKKSAAIVGGPWLMSGINNAQINLGIKSLSDFSLPNGNKLAPYAGVQSVGIMQYAAKNKKDAIAKVLEALTSEDLAVELAKTSNCAPANVKAYENEAVSSDEMIVAMKDTAQTAEPMPNIPQVSVMWTPAEAMLAAVNKSEADIDDAAKQYEKDAETAIADMQ